MAKEITNGDKIKAYVSIGNTEYQFEILGKFESLTDKQLVVTDASYKGHLLGYRERSQESDRVEIERSKLVMFCLAD